MAEHYRFFNSTSDDIREYNASEFAEYFSRFVSDGIFSEDNKLALEVTAGNGLNINIDRGYAFVRGYLYRNDSTLTKSIEPADSSLDRIDRVVLRFDEVAREIKVDIKVGQFSSSPRPASIEVTGTVKEMPLAQVRVNAGSNSVSITDERLSEETGIAGLLIDIPVKDLKASWNNFLTENKNELDLYRNSINEQIQDAIIDWDTWKDDEKAAFEDWLNNLEFILSEDEIAGVVIKADENRDRIMDLEDGKMDKSKITISDKEADVILMNENDIWIKYE